MSLKEYQIGQCNYLVDDDLKKVYIEDEFVQVNEAGVQERRTKWRDTNGSYDQFLADLDRLAPKESLDDHAKCASEVEGRAPLTDDEAKQAIVDAQKAKFKGGKPEKVSK